MYRRPLLTIYLPLVMLLVLCNVVAVASMEDMEEIGETSQVQGTGGSSLKTKEGVVITIKQGEIAQEQVYIHECCPQVNLIYSFQMTQSYMTYTINYPLLRDHIFTKVYTVYKCP